jgi:hypothetical protein
LLTLIEDESQWTNSIPSPLVLYQYIEELPQNMTESEFVQWAHGIPHLSSVPQPPTLPRILDKVIVNAEPKRRWEEQPNIGGAPPPAGLDDNSILAVPNHVVLNHLTASAIKNGTLGVGTTTRYRKKVSTVCSSFTEPFHGAFHGAAAILLPHVGVTFMLGRPRASWAVPVLVPSPLPLCSPVAHVPSPFVHVNIGRG